MKVKLLLIALLLVGSNGWANEAFDNCIAVAEEAKNNVLQPKDWKMIDDSIDKEEADVDAEAISWSMGIPINALGASKSIVRKHKQREYKIKRLQEIQQKRIDLEFDRQQEQSRIVESKREAVKDYMELLKVCADLIVVKPEDGTS